MKWGYVVLCRFFVFFSHNMSGFGLRWLFLRDALAVDEEAASERRRQRRNIQRRRRLALDGFSMSNREFIKTYRLTKPLAEALIRDLKPYIPRNRRKDGMDVAVKVLITLAFYASGSYQTLVGQSTTHAVSQPSVSRAVQQVTKALNHPVVFKKYVYFPLTREEREIIRNVFYSKFGFPGVVGCIDGTHVSIIKPSEHEEAFYSHKGYHSLNVMIICDADQNIICVDPSSPGSTPDSTIWRDHPLNNYLNTVIDEGESIFLLGDSGYDLRRNLITPILNSEEGSPENWFYKKHLETRNIVEHTISVLKARFRCLLVARQLHYKPEMAAKIVNACCVLHNLANRARLGTPALTEREHDEEQRLQVYEQVPASVADAASTFSTDRGCRQNQPLSQGRAVQQQIVRSLWALRN